MTVHPDVTADLESIGTTLTTVEKVLDTIEADGLLEHVTVLGQKIRDGLAADPRVTEVRGEGLLIGLDLASESAAAVVEAAQDAGFIINMTTPSHHQSERLLVFLS
mgnify:CR=1 FL=1